MNTPIISLSVEKALSFGKAVAEVFMKDERSLASVPERACQFPSYETAFALSRLLDERGERERARITIVSPDPPGLQLDDYDVTIALRKALSDHDIEFQPDFPIDRVTTGAATTSNGHGINFNLLMLLPPFQGSPASAYLGITNDESPHQRQLTMRARWS